MPQEPPEAPGELRVEVGPLWGHCILHWTPPAGGADGYDVQSTLNGWTYVGFAGATIPGDATQAELDFSSVATELVAIDLKIRARRGTNVSDYSPSGRCAVPLHPIGPLVPAFTSDGMRLVWLGGSMVATGFVIDRAELNTSGAPGPWSQLARAPFPMVRSDGYLDTTVQTGKAYAYRIAAVTDDQRSDSAEATTLRLTPGLTSGTQSLPIAQTMAADGKGHFAFASHGFGMLRVIWRNSADWIATDLQSFGSSVDVQLDKSGLPHSVYLKAPASGTGSLITHGWSDGTQWLEETIAQRSLTETSLTGALRFAIDAAGNPVIVWWNLDRVFEGAIKVDGAWQITSFDLVPDDLGYAYGLFSDHSGVAHALFASMSGIWNLAAVNGRWTSEKLPLPLAVFQPGGYSPLLGVGQDPDHLVVCTALFAEAPLSSQVGCLRKTPAGWSNVERLGVVLRYASSAQAHTTAALSDDGSRLAIILGGDATHLFRSDGGGPWTETIVRSQHMLLLAFDAGGKLSLLSSNTGEPQDLTLGDYIFDTEP